MSASALIIITSTLAGFASAALLITLIRRHIPDIIETISRSAMPHLTQHLNERQEGQAATGFDNIRETAESHVDDFLRNRLGQEMPMIGMFIGDKTIAQLKTVFMKELEQIFPIVMQAYLNGAVANNSHSALLSAQARKNILQPLMFELRKLYLCGIVTGFLTGILQVVVLKVLG